MADCKRRVRTNVTNVEGRGTNTENDLIQLHSAQRFTTFSFCILNSGLSFPDLATTLAKYQNPREADAMTKIQTDLDDTKIILVRSCLFYLWNFYTFRVVNEMKIVVF